MRHLTTVLILVAIAAITKLPQVVSSHAATDPTSSGASSPAAAKESAGGKPDSESAKSNPKERPTFPANQVAVANAVFIATLPDPKLTHLGLQFDRFVDTVQRAAEGRGYRFESQWLPWSVDSYRYSDPGVLLFQRGDEHLALLLVGESPASGVAESQMRKAITIAETHGALKILGPFFSGGFHSLSKILEGHKAEIYGGAPSSATAIAEFEHAGFNYKSFIASSSEATKRLAEYWAARHVTVPGIVELNEAGTEYGASSPFAFAGAVVIPFPRDLSVLRRAYESDQRLAKTISQQSTDAAVVQITKAEDSGGGDTVPIQTPSPTAATQELQLQTVARTIHEHRYLLGSIQATNILDTLFLRQYMAAHVPDTQFVLLEPDVLFLHAPENNAFQGSIAVSHYPMLSSPGLKHPVFFPSNASAGLYLAARAMIPMAKEEPRVDQPVDPSDLWITIIGLDGYWPVAHSQSTSRDLFRIRVPSAYGAAYLTLMAALWGMVWALWNGAKLTARQQRPDRDKSKPEPSARRWYADYVFDPRAPLNYARRYHAFTVVIALTVLLLVLSWPLAEMWSGQVFLSVLPAFLGVYLTHPFGRESMIVDKTSWYDPRKALHDRQSTPLMAFGVVLGGGAPIAMLHFEVWKPALDGWNHFAAYRSMFLGNGVNPTLPMLFAALSVGTCAWYHFQRFIFASERFVPLCLEENGDLDGPYKRVRDVLSQYNTRPALLCSLFVMFLVLALALSHDGAFSIEGCAYDWTFIAVLTISSGFTMLSVCQFLQAWWHLSDFLKALATLPMQSVFRDLPRDLGSVALFQASPRQRSYLYATRCRDLLHEINGVPADVKARVDQTVQALQRRSGADERETACEAIAAQAALKDAQELLLNALREGFWQKGQSELVPDKEKPDYRVAAEEFLALRFVAFIRYATVQLRNLLSFFSVSFILQAMAVSSYPFFTQGLTRMYILCAFAVMSGTAGYVLIGMGRDQLLKTLATDPKGSDSPILWQALQTASLPLLTFASTYFPDLGRSLFSWLIPMLSSAK